MVTGAAYDGIATTAADEVDRGCMLGIRSLVMVMKVLLSWLLVRWVEDACVSGLVS